MTLAAYQKQIVDRRRIVVVQALLLEVLAHLDYLSLLITNRLPQVLDLRELEAKQTKTCATAAERCIRGTDRTKLGVALYRRACAQRCVRARV